MSRDPNKYLKLIVIFIVFYGFGSFSSLQLCSADPWRVSQEFVSFDVNRGVVQKTLDQLQGLHVSLVVSRGLGIPITVTSSFFCVNY